MLSCFEDLIIGKIMGQFKLNLDSWFRTYSFFFSFKFACMWVTSSLLSSAWKESFFLSGIVAKQSTVNGLN